MTMLKTILPIVFFCATACAMVDPSVLAQAVIFEAAHDYLQLRTTPVERNKMEKEFDDLAGGERDAETLFQGIVYDFFFDHKDDFKKGDVLVGTLISAESVLVLKVDEKTTIKITVDVKEKKLGEEALKLLDKKVAVFGVKGDGDILAAEFMEWDEAQVLAAKARLRRIYVKASFYLEMANVRGYLLPSKVADEINNNKIAGQIRRFVDEEKLK